MKSPEECKMINHSKTWDQRLVSAVKERITGLRTSVTGSSLLPTDNELQREIIDVAYKPSLPWSITRQTEPLQGLSRQDWVEYFSLRSVGFKGRVTGGNQIATASDISRYAKDLSLFGYGEEAEKYSKLARRLRMLGNYNYTQGIRFSNLTQAKDSPEPDFLKRPRELPNRSMRRHLGL